MPGHPCTRDYYLASAEGFRNFTLSRGKTLSPRLRKLFKLLNVKRSHAVLDVGCGRGELVLHAAHKGAHAVGIDISPDAIALAREIQAHWAGDERHMRGRCEFIEADAARLPFENERFDRVILAGIVEYLPPERLPAALAETARVLKSGGAVVLQASPARRFLAHGLAIYRFIGGMRGIAYGRNMRRYLPEDLGRGQSLSSLRRLFRRAGFSAVDLWRENSEAYARHFFEDTACLKAIDLVSRFAPARSIMYPEIYGMIRK